MAQGMISVGVAGSVNIGLGDFGDKYETGYGGTAMFYFSPSASTDISLSVGYNRWDKDNLGFITIPLMGGFRYYYDLKVCKIYIPAFLGIHFTTKEAKLPSAEVNSEIIGGNEISLSDIYFGFGFGVGALISLSSKIYLDIGTTFNSVAETESNLN